MRGNSGSERSSRMASSPVDHAPRRLGWTVRLGVAGAVLSCCWLGLGLAVATPKPIELEVFLPSPGYKRGRHATCKYTEFKETQILWGTCAAGDEIGELMGKYSARSHHMKARITVARTPVCIVAVVIDLDGQPMGRSYPVRFTDQPGKPKVLSIG
jgi:hypothetical protein